MIKKVEKIGANALIGVKVNTKSMPMANKQSSMLIVTVTGTAVVIE